MKNKVLIIVGMHRSGTSLISNWLQKCGLDIGTQLLGEHFSNPDGHFEDLEFLQLHEEILSSFKRSNHGVINPTNFVINELQEKKINDLVQLKNKKTNWGWKDPRTCLLLDVYRKLLPDANYLMVIRPYQEIIDSLVRRKYKSTESKIRQEKLGFLKVQRYRLTLKKKGLEEAIRYYESAVINYYSHMVNHLKAVDSKQCICIQLEAAQQMDEQIITKLNNQHGFSLEYMPIHSVFKKKLLSNEAKCYTANTANSKKLDQLQHQLESFCLKMN